MFYLSENLWLFEYYAWKKTDISSSLYRLLENINDVKKPSQKPPKKIENLKTNPVKGRSNNFGHVECTHVFLHGTFHSEVDAILTEIK